MGGHDDAARTLDADRVRRACRIRTRPIRARTGEGLSAQGRGVHMGRPPKLTPHQKREALKGHCQSNFYTACSRPRQVGAPLFLLHELPPRLADPRRKSPILICLDSARRRSSLVAVSDGDRPRKAARVVTSRRSRPSAPTRYNGAPSCRRSCADARGLMALPDIAKAPFSHGVEPHDFETGGPALVSALAFRLLAVLLVVAPTARAV